MTQKTLTLNRLSLLSALLLCLLLLPVFSNAQQGTNLVGTWRSGGSGAPITITFNDDGTGELGGVSISYAVRGNNIVVTDAGVVHTYTFRMNGNTMTVSEGDLDQPLILERQGPAATGGIGARRRQAAEAGNTAPSVVGAWERHEGQQSYRLVLRPDGSGSLNGAPLRWALERGVLTLTGSEKTFRFNATVTPSSLTLSGGNTSQAATFNRVSDGESSASGTGEGSTGRGKGGGLVGYWKSDQYTAQVKDNGTVVINGETFSYRVQGNVITLTGNEGSIDVQFELSGDTLITVFNGQRTVYTRVPEGPDGEGRSGGSLPRELIGKWCYMSNVNAGNGGRMSNRCFTLRPDGTYQYYSETSSSGAYGGSASQESDSGTWSATATTITANSRTNGRQTYRLEKRNHPKTGDPMLVLDGDAYVTYNQRPPW